MDSFRAQNRTLAFKRISVEQGLSQSNVLCILQDRIGFLWFGTEDGLNRYDGYDFKIYRHNPSELNSLPDDVIQTLREDDQGRLWIGTAAGGLCSYDPGKELFTRYYHDPANRNSIGHNNVRAIIQDHQGKLWIGTYGGGVSLFDPLSQRFTHFQHNPDENHSLSDNFVTSILEDSDGRIWVGTLNGLNQLLSITDKHWLRITHSPPDPYTISNSHILSITETADGTLWVGTMAGLNRLLGDGTPRFVRYQEMDYPGFQGDNVQVLWEDRSGYLWIGTYHGIKRLDRTNSQFRSYRFEVDDPAGLSEDNVTAIYEDQAGLMWIGTRGGGLSMLNPNPKEFQHFTHDPSNTNSLSFPGVRGIYEDEEGILWAGGYGGLNRIDRKAGQIRHYRAHDPDHKLDTDIVYSIIGDPKYEHILWIGSEGDGLYRFDKRTGQADHFLPPGLKAETNMINTLLNNRFVFALYLDSERVLWVATDRGLNKLVLNDQQKFTPSAVRATVYEHDPENPHSLAGNDVRVILEDRLGDLWIGTNNNGLSRYDRQTNRFVNYRHDLNDPASLSSNRIKSIYEDETGTLWIGTAGGGLNRFNPPTETFEYFTEYDGLSNNVVYGILEDNAGDLWLSTNQGLSHFNHHLGTFRNYDSRDGLQHNEFNTASYYKSKSGEMLFGGINGFNAFYPENIRDDSFVPPVVLTDFQLFNASVSLSRPDGEHSVLSQTITITDKIVLTYQDNVFSFVFSALSYAIPSKNLYACKLEGFDKDWILRNADQRQVTYTTLPAGNYIFRVKGSNHDGVWNDNGSSINILILPPPWETWWAYSLYVFLVVGLVSLFYFRHVNKLKEKSVWQQKTIDNLKEIDTLRKTALDNYKKYRRLFQQSRHAIFILKKDEGFTDVNQSFLDLFGFARDELNHLDIRDLFVESAHQQRYEHDLIRNGSIMDYETTLRKKDGTEIDCLISASIADYPEQKGSSTQGIIRDITAWKKAQSDLEEKTMYLDNILSSATEYAIAATDLDFRITYYNPMAEKLHGYRAQEVIGKTVQEIHTREKVAAERFERAIKQVMEYGEYSYIIEKQEKEGTRYIDTRISGIYDKNRKLVGFLNFAHDITDKKLARERFSRRLINSQEQERKRIAHELHDSIGQAMLIIKNLALLGLQPDQKKTEMTSYLTKISADSTEAIGNIQEIARNLRPYQLDRLGLTKALESIFIHWSEASPIQVAYNIDPLDEAVRPEMEIHIYRIIQECVNNIIKHSQASEAMVLIQKSRKNIDITIKDDGQGYDPQASLSETAPSGGLGLPGITERVSIMRGKLEIKSAPGEGTTILISIPYR